MFEPIRILFLLPMQVKGIKGASILIVHSPFDMVKGVAIVNDSLHVFFLGVVQDLLKYWFDKNYRTYFFSIYSKVNYSRKYIITVTYIIVV